MIPNILEKIYHTHDTLQTAVATYKLHIHNLYLSY